VKSGQLLLSCRQSLESMSTHRLLQESCLMDSIPKDFCNDHSQWIKGSNLLFLCTPLNGTITNPAALDKILAFQSSSAALLLIYPSTCLFFQNCFYHQCLLLSIQQKPHCCLCILLTPSQVSLLLE
jgi:hypothetical protein